MRLYGMAAAMLLVGGLAGASRNAVPDETRVSVVFSGGHDTDPRDRGRPVALIAAALGVKPEVFREAFSHVHPAPAGTEPDPEQVRRNKDALLGALGRYGVTNERLDQVSNYYRYQPGRGRLWPTRTAAAYAVVEKGVVKRFVVTDGGAGYSSPPIAELPGVAGVQIRLQLAFGKELETNGAVSSLSVAAARPKE